MVVHPVGLSDTSGSDTLWAVTEANQGASSFLEHSVRGKTTKPVPVRVETLDHMLSAQPLSVSLIKIDVQGLELQVLKGAMNVIQKFRPSLVFECERAHFSSAMDADRVGSEIQTLFRDLEYSVYYISRYGPNFLAPVRWRDLPAGDLLALPMSSGSL